MARDHQHDHGEGTNTRRLAMTLALVLVYMGVEVIGVHPHPHTVPLAQRGIQRHIDAGPLVRQTIGAGGVFVVVGHEGPVVAELCVYGNSRS